MRSANGTARSGHPRSRTDIFSPQNAASQQQERDADATMMVEGQHDYTGQITDLPAVAGEQAAVVPRFMAAPELAHHARHEGPKD